jgi:hypothetical protein
METTQERNTESKHKNTKLCWKNDHLET